MGEPVFVGEGGDEMVAASGEFRRGSVVGRRSAGDNQQAAFAQRRFPRGGKAQLLQAAGGADDDRRRSAQKDAEAFCQSQGGHLAAYISKVEQNLVEQTFMDRVGGMEA